MLAVHGVADQQQNASVKQICNLLLNLDNCGHPLYSCFRESAIRIQARAVRVVNPPSAPDCAREVNPFQEWVGSHLRRPGALDEADHAFIRGQIECYKGEDPDEPYETVRLEGVRLGACAANVHLYEMYWADLSRLAGAVLRVVGEVYQVLLHLPTVGVHTLRAAQLEHPDDANWKRFVVLQNFAVWLLQVPIALANLLLVALALAVAVGGLLAKLPWRGQCGLLCVGATAVTIILVCTALYRSKARLPSIALIGLLGFLAGSAAAAFAWFVEVPEPVLAWGVVLAAVIASLVATTLVVRSYDRRRPRATVWWWRLIALATAVFAITVWYRSPEPFRNWPYQSWLWLLRGVEIAFGIAISFWIVFHAAAIAVHIAGSLAVSKADERGRRARWTARLTLTLSALAFIVLSTALWAGITGAFSPMIPDITLYYRSLFLMPETVLASQFGSELVTQSALTLPTMGLLSILGVVMLITGLTPVVVAELKHPTGKNATPEASTRLGDWLTGASSAALWAGRAFYVALVFVMPANTAAFLLSASVREAFSGGVGLFIAWLGGLVAGSAVGLFALGRSLERFAGLLAPLDVLLDVDNYIREHPRDENPTARIFGRYVSVLRSISEWRDAEGCPYDALVIIAHSQGTVITADLLRFLQSEYRDFKHPDPDAEYDSGLKRLLAGEMPVYLFTMGSPLRHLYGRRFPHLYKWAWHAVTTPMSPFQAPDLLSPPDREPDPGKLGVRQWVNAFRSGDYIGRHLWRSDICDYAWLPPQAVPPDNKRSWDVSKTRLHNVTHDAGHLRTEMCIGAGAHTHYWDEHAPEVACELDRLIQLAAGCDRQVIAAGRAEIERPDAIRNAPSNSSAPRAYRE